MQTKTQSKGQVQKTASRLREMVLGNDPDTLLGSLQELTQKLGVGTVTLQQASRILEHEGLLEVRRGPGGGYFGTRPDESELDHSISQFLTAYAANEHEATDIVHLLEAELLALAAKCTNESPRSELNELRKTIKNCNSSAKRINFEAQMHDILFRMVNRPLTELLVKVLLKVFYTSKTKYNFYDGEEGLSLWKRQRDDIIEAILRNDSELARFHGKQRHNYMIRSLEAGMPDNSNAQ